MTKLKAYIKQTFRETALSNICYFIVFVCLIPTFADNGVTIITFILIDLFVVILSYFYYTLSLSLIQPTKWNVGIVTKALLFFVLTELSVLTITGELPVFGLYQIYVYHMHRFAGNKTFYYDSYLFLLKRNFSLSISGMISAVTFLIAQWLHKKKRQQIAPSKTV